MPGKGNNRAPTCEKCILYKCCAMIDSVDPETGKIFSAKDCSQYRSKNVYRLITILPNGVPVVQRKPGAWMKK